VIASPPYFEDLPYQNEGSTYYGDSSSSSSGTDKSEGGSTSAALGFKTNFSVFGATFETSVKATVTGTFEDTWSVEEEVEETWGYYTNQGEDMVLFTSYPVDVYVYRIVSSGGEAQLPTEYDGGERLVSVTIPRANTFYAQPVDYFNDNQEDKYKIKLPWKLGEPFTYANKSQRDTLQAAGKGLFTTKDNFPVSVGNNGGVQSIAKSKTEGFAATTGASLSVEAEFTVSCVTVGGGRETNSSLTVTNSTTTGTSFEGSVAGIPASAYVPSEHLFNWGIMAFPYNNSGVWDLANDDDGVIQKYMLATYWLQH
jgi:hypothetical protein